MERSEKILGVEGGGTKTAWVLVERIVAGIADPGSQWRIVDQGKLPPSNFRLTTPARLRAIFSELPKENGRAGIFLAGCGPGEDQQSLSRLSAEIWPTAKIIVGNDRESGLAAALEHGDGIVVNAGSGSSVTGRRGERRCTRNGNHRERRSSSERIHRSSRGAASFARAKGHAARWTVSPRFDLHARISAQT